MTEKETPIEKQPITVTEGAEAPFLLYAGDDEKVHVRVLIHAETLWLPQRQMAELFQTTPDNIGLHLRNIYAEGELAEIATAEDFSVVQNEGGRAVRRTLNHYSLDAIIAKNYLSEPEIKRLERTIAGFFDYIENIIENRVQMSMVDMAASVDKFLSFNEYEVLTHKGNISKMRADQKALAEYAEFNRTQKIESDFDRVLKATKALGQNEVKVESRKRKTKTD